MGGHLLVDHEYFLKKIGKSICISKNSVYFSVSIEKINLPEISLSYLKSRWLKNPICLSSACSCNVYCFAIAIKAQMFFQYFWNISHQLSIEAYQAKSLPILNAKVSKFLMDHHINCGWNNSSYTLSWKIKPKGSIR